MDVNKYNSKINGHFIDLMFIIIFLSQRPFELLLIMSIHADVGHTTNIMPDNVRTRGDEI